MRSILPCLILLAGVAACETSTDPFTGIGGGAGLTQTQATGNWSFTVHPTGPLACGTGSLADNQVLLAHLDVLADGTVSAANSFWQDPQGIVRPLSGSITLGTGSARLFLAASSGSAAVMELQGTFAAAGSFSGTLRDPRAGSSVVFSACTYNTTGNKTS